MALDYFTRVLDNCRRHTTNFGDRDPPALLLQGEADSDVPHEQSVMMAEAVAAAGVEH